MTKIPLRYSFFLVILSSWLAWTVLIDFVVVRTVFATIDNFFQAGDLGVALFSKLNNLELISSSALITILAFEIRFNKKVFFLLILSILAWFITLYYFSYLTPKLILLTDLWKQSEQTGTVILSRNFDIQQEHQFFHQLYRTLDSIKLVLLFIMLILGISKKDLWS
jgi:hypothetical protein